MPASKSRSTASKGTRKGAGAGGSKARSGAAARRGAAGGGAMTSLSEADRRYMEQSLSDARSSGAAGGEHDVLDVLERFGLSSARVQQLRGALAKVDVRESVDKASEYLSEQIKSARDYTRDNKGKVIGGAAGVLVGASLLAYALKRASDEKARRSSSRSSSSKKSSGGSKKSSGGSKKSSGGSKKSRSRK